MRLGPGPGWQMSVSDPTDLFLALYVRDAAGLAAAPGYPPLEPAVPSWAAPWTPAERDAAVRQWERWWAALLASRSAQVLDLPEVPTAGAPELDQARRELFGQAWRWRAAHPVPRTPERLAESFPAADLVGELERTLGRRARPFSYAVETIPTRGERYWDLSPTRLLLSEALLTDAESCRDVLRPRLAVLV